VSASATERLKAVDRALSPLAARTGKAIAAAARLAPRVRAGAAAPPHSLVVRPGGMGDLIAAHIAWEELGQDPRAGVLWLVERRSAAWARHARLPHLAYDDGLLRALRSVAGRFALAINTEQRFGLSQAVAEAAVARGGRSVALSTNLAAAQAGRTVPYDPYDEHETVAFRRLFAQALGLEADVRPRPRPRSAPSAGTRLVAISGRQSPVRDLTLDQWQAHVDAWAGPDRPVAIAAAPVDADFAGALAARLGRRASRFHGSFDALCARIATAEEVLTMDGGPVHLASYFGTPTRALFTAGRESKWAPLALGSTIVRRDGLPGQPCTLFGQTPRSCPCDARCRDLDPVRDVRASPAAAASSSAR
jgi:hypothetical protein